MKKSLSVSLALALFLSGGVAASALTRIAWSKSPTLTDTPSSSARYQLIVPNVNNAGDQYVIDTATGRVWYRYGTGVKDTWQEQSPDVTKAPIITGR